MGMQYVFVFTGSKAAFIGVILRYSEALRIPRKDKTQFHKDVMDGRGNVRDTFPW
jgi:hypothetical protein